MVPSADPESYLSSVLIPDQDYSNLVEGKIKFFQFFSKFESDFCVKHYSKLGITFLTFIFLTVSLIVTVFCESKFYQNSKSKILFLVPKPDPGSLAITVPMRFPHNPGTGSICSERTRKFPCVIGCNSYHEK